MTGNRAGVTKQTQWVSIGDNIELCDTPGTLYPNLENQDVAKKLFFIGSIKDEVVADNLELALELIAMLGLFQQCLFAFCRNIQNIFKIDMAMAGR